MTLDNLFTSTGKLNSAILRRDWFKVSDQYQEILSASRELNVFVGVDFADRVWYLRDRLQLNHCSVCGKPYIVFHHSQHRYALCNHKQHRDRYKGLNHSINEKKKNSLRQTVVDHLDPFLSDEVFARQLKSVPTQLNYRFPITADTRDFLHDLIVRTISLLPLTEDFQFAQRYYIVQNQIKELPKCMVCGGEVTFIDRFKGWRKTCNQCKVVTANTTRSENTNAEIESHIDHDRYEIVKLPGLVNKEPLIVRCKKCGKESEWMLHNGRIALLGMKPLCRHCERCVSKPEEELKVYCQSLCNNVVFNDRRVIAPKELDIYIPSKKLAIEFNGLYWHSDACGFVDEVFNKRRHLEKLNMCTSIGLRLIQVFADEWETKRSIVESRIASLLGRSSQRVYARLCDLREIGHKEAEDFLDANHLQGSCNAKINLGLFYKEDLLSVMTFSKARFSQTAEWELLRYCSKCGFSIPGAASKLLTAFERTYHPASIVSYADRRWSVGGVYERLGFTLSHVSDPNYWYVVNGVRQSRIKFQKHRLQKMLGDKYNAELSESENMKAAGYGRIYDCGNLVYLKTYPTTVNTY